MACTHNLSFLSLPPAVRRQVYFEAGLVNGLDLILDGGAKPEPDSVNDLGLKLDRSMEPGSVCDFQVSRNLRLTCRAIHAEVSAIIYSSNRFLIRYRDAQGLQPLRDLTPRSLSSLTCLALFLNVAPDVDHDRCDWERRKLASYSKSDKLLTTLLRKHRVLLSEWQRTASYVLAHIEPSRLQFHLVCDVEDAKTARHVIEPLLGITTFADCSIRLGPQLDPVLQHLAGQTATQAVGKRHDCSDPPFPFMDLPPELRHQVLEYTDIVTPLCEVEWNPQKGYDASYSNLSCGRVYCGEWYCFPEEVHHACFFRSCWERTRHGCFCRRYHSAYSSTCHCWSPPTSLFLVCRALREDVQAVFFTRNRFVITPAKGCMQVAEGTPARLEVSTFLTKTVPADALKFLTFLEVVFPPFKGDYLRPNEPAYKDWLQTIRTVKDALNPARLTLRVYMADAIGDNAFRRSTTEGQGMAVIKTYERVLQPLSQFRERGLRKFFAHLAWRFRWTPSGGIPWTEQPDYVERQTAELEQQIETAVMGSGYNAVSQGKWTHRNSQWLESHLLSSLHA